MPESIFDLPAKEARLTKLESQAGDPDLWNDSDKARDFFKQIKQLKVTVEPWRACAREAEDACELAQMMQEEGEDAETLVEVRQLARQLTRRIEELEFQALLAEETDINNCFLHIHPGAGGTESCDWAQMLLRMFSRYCEEHEYKVTLLDLQPGDEAGIKSVELRIEGDFAFGYLKAESGVHRLVRISPFDAGKRRHTSFASVHVSPEVDDSIEIEVDEKDLRIDTYRSSGAGGQHVNVTDSAVRITHEPTGIVVCCQNERSQRQNKEFAMSVLRSRLYLLELEKRQDEADKKQADKKKIAWGSQIRSYVFHPYNMVKDHRTNVETSNVSAVMDGALDEFITGYLKWSVGK
jgi:peptide chain release factor 2